MSPDEKIACQNLLDRRLGSVVFEPDGNVPPDFLVDKRIAVEVRRLNQNWITGSKTEGLEELFFPLRQKIQKFLKSLGPPSAGVSWYVSFRFKRPLISWKRLQGPVGEYLEAFRLGKAVDTTVSITRNFHLDLYPARTIKPYHFVGVLSDFNAGGFIVAEVLKNLEICIAEKTLKTARFRAKYPEWWLVLIDYIARETLDDSDRETLRDWVKAKHDWDKIILVNPLDARSTFES